MNNKSYSYRFDLLPSHFAQEQLNHLFRFGFTYLWIHILCGSLLFAMLWFSYPINHWLMGIWYTALISISTMRWLSCRPIRPYNNYSCRRLQHLAQRYLILTTTINSLWGISGMILFIEEPIVLALHITLLVLVSLSNLALLTLSRSALYLQIGVVFTPIIITLFLQQNLQFVLLGTALISLAGMMALSSYVFSLVLNSWQVAQQRLLEQMHTDPLTNLANRRYFDQVFKLEWRRSARDGESLSLLMIDVDQFKSFNDQYGHQAGDQCLQAIARCLRSVAQRASDVVARHGGEEFLVLLPKTDLTAALKVAEQLRATVERQAIGHDEQQRLRHVTVSIGISCCLPSTIRTEVDKAENKGEVLFPAMLLHAADRALYRAKRNGRNQVAHELCGEDNLEADTSSPPALTQAA